MPFTFSHPALVIPLLHLQRQHPWLSATGLIMGSMAPDGEKFLRLRLANSHSHTFGSVFYFSCPVALVLAFTFHLLVRKPLLRHLPAPLYRRLACFIDFDWTDYFRTYYWGVLFSIIIGALLHLFWDSFTHPSPWLSQFLPILSQPVGVGGEQLPFFYLAGLVSSLLGGAVIAWAVWRMPVRRVRAVPTTGAVGRYWGIVGLVTVLLAAQWLLATKPDLMDGGIATISSALVGLLVASVYTTYINQKLVHR